MNLRREGASAHAGAVGLGYADDGTNGGGSDPGAANVIQANDGAGVSIEGVTSTGVRLSRNAEVANGDPGIVRLEGAETLVSPPLIELTGQTIIGTGAPNSTIEIFATDEPPDPTGAGEGATFLGSVMSDEQGAFSFSLTQLRDISSPPMHVTATLTDGSGDTSVYAQNIDVAATTTPTEIPTSEATLSPTLTPTPPEVVMLTPTPTVPTTEASLSGEIAQRFSNGYGGPTVTEALVLGDPPRGTQTPGSTPTATATPVAAVSPASRRDSNAWARAIGDG